MTFDDDFLQMEAGGMSRRFTVNQLGYDWPPPREIVWGGYRWQRQRYSLITDAEREERPNRARGAIYTPLSKPEPVDVPPQAS